MLRLTLALLTAAMLAGCKIEVTVPDGGSVVSQSGSFRCNAGQTCSIDVYDTQFDETFEAIPASGYRFVGWAGKDRGLCGGDDKPCELQTAGFADNPNLMTVLESDEVFYLEPVFEQTAPSPTLYLLGGAQEQFFLGCLSCSPLHFQSVCNTATDYGSPAGVYSIWNASGDFGSRFSNFSPWNGFAMLPPAIYDTDGLFYGYLTTNPSNPNRTPVTRLADLVVLAATGRYDLLTLQAAFCQ